MLHVFDTPEVLLPALADFVADKAKTSMKRHGRFDFVLSGGGSPKKLFELLATSRYKESIDWARVYFFFGDERYVPLDHQDSNFRMAKEALFAPLNISQKNIFPINTSLSPAAAAQDYEHVIRNHFNGEACQFDLILLGLGDNSHTASLFPNTSILSEKKALIKEIFVEEVNMYRITFTAPLINAAHTIAFLVYGGGKAEAVRHILKDPEDIPNYPAQLIRPSHGELHWFLDEPAANLVS